MKRTRVGILGGSFNPPHSGHLQISKLAIKKLGLKQLWWIPTIQNPLKTQDISSSYEERIRLCEYITKADPRIKVKDLEKRFFKNSWSYYTFDLLQRLNRFYPHYEFYFIIGADSLVNFHKWYKFESINKLCKIIVFNRPGYLIEAKRNRKYATEIIYSTNNNISSTALRNG